MMCLTGCESICLSYLRALDGPTAFRVFIVQEIVGAGQLGLAYRAVAASHAQRNLLNMLDSLSECSALPGPHLENSSKLALTPQDSRFLAALIRGSAL